MSALEDFETAPMGATATHKATGNRVMKVDGVELRWITRWGRRLTDKEVVRWGFTLEPPAPATAREALNLAWKLAYPVREGQTIPAGTRYILSPQDGVVPVCTAFNDWIPNDPETIRTIEPLTEPDWQDAPAVLAATSRCSDRKVWTKVDKCYKNTDGEIIYWTNLLDVTPLYPNEKETK